jgi:hypothetical protein
MRKGNKKNNDIYSPRTTIKAFGTNLTNYRWQGKAGEGVG